MGNLRPFQIVLLAIFGVFAIGALILLGAYQAKVSQEKKVYGNSVEVWGTFEAYKVMDEFAVITKDDKQFGIVRYKQIDEANFEDTLVNAIAEGNSPDLIILPSSKLVSLRSKLVAVPYETYPLRTLKDTYIDGVEIFTFPEGLYAIPLAVDPLVQYWNRDLYASAGLAKAASTWEELVNLVVPSLVVRDTTRTLLQNAVAFGEYRNLTNPKAIILAMTLQSGSKMVYLENGEIKVGLNSAVQAGQGRSPLEVSVDFFTGFSNSNSPLYTWNRAQQNDKNAFLAGDLATYFGFISEYEDITRKNPNLNFDVSPIPQGSTATIKRTYGEFYGLAIPKAAKNSQGAYAAALTMVRPAYAAEFAERLGLIAPRRDVIAAGNTNPIIQTALSAALIARGWLDPNPVASDEIFLEMIEDVVSNRTRADGAARVADERLLREF